MHAFKINGKQALKSMESWLKGRAELLFDYIANHGTPLSTPDFRAQEKFPTPMSRKEAKNGTWKSQNITLIKWQNITVADKTKFEWKEREGNGGKESPRNSQLIVVVKGVTITLNQPINWRRKDRSCGQQVVDYCDDVLNGGTDYNTGLISFNVRI